MANTLKLVGNSIELNRNLSSGDAGVLGPFTIQATQNGMSAAANFNLTVGGAAGPVPLPSPYPLQPGFTPISDPSQITGPGNYQLTADVQTINIQGMSNVTIDGGGHVVANNLITSGQNVLIRNCHLNSGISIGGGNITIINNWVLGSSGIFTSNVTISNNLLDGVNAAAVDDVVLVQPPSTTLPLSNIGFFNNIFQNAWDCGVEGIGGMTQCTFQNNHFNHLGNGAMGGWWDRTLSKPAGFVMTYCSFRGNIADAATVNSLFDFEAGGHGYANDDATAAALWGGDGSDGNIVNNNTFSGNLRQ